MSSTAATARDALRVVQESFPWVMQTKDPKSGVWHDLGKPIQGRTKAYAALNDKKAKDKGRHEYRVIPKNEADKYKEGLNTVRKRAKPSTRRPLLALPENL